MSEKLKALYIKNSRLPSRYTEDIILYPQPADVKAFERLDNIKNKITIFMKKHNNLLITSSNTGNGKTTWAAKIILHYIDSYAQEYSFKDNTPVLFVNIPEYLTKKKLAMSDKALAEEISEIEKAIFTAKIVVFDDIATKIATDYDREVLYMYINNRTDNFLTNIYTTNISIYNLSNELGSRLADRIVGYSTCIELNGAGMRGNA